MLDSQDPVLAEVDDDVPHSLMGELRIGLQWDTEVTMPETSLRRRTARRFPSGIRGTRVGVGSRWP